MKIIGSAARTAYMLGVSALCLGGVLSTTVTPAFANEDRYVRIDEKPSGEIDPHKARDFADSILIENIYDTLVVPAGGSSVGPHLATGWTTDGNSVVFELRDDVTFHSGNKMTAADVVYSFNRMRDMGLGRSFVLGSQIGEAVAEGDYTVRFTMNEPFAPFLAAMSQVPIVDSALVEQHVTNGDFASEWLSENDAGSGAYQLVSHKPQEETVMERFDGYFLGVPEQAPDGMRFRYGLAAPTVRTLLETAGHDISSPWLPPEVLVELSQGENTKILAVPATTQMFFKLNTQRAPLDDVHCRRALSYALDYEAVRSVMKVAEGINAASPSNGPIPKGLMGNDPSVADFGQDLERAKEELAQCKYAPADHTLEVAWISGIAFEERFALLMQANFGQLGFNVEIVSTPWAKFAELVTDPAVNPHVNQVMASPVTPDTDSLLYNSYHSSRAGTWQSAEWLDDVEVDRMLDEARGASDPAVREQIYRDLSARIVELAPTIFPYNLMTVFGANNRISAPRLEDPAQTLPAISSNFAVRKMVLRD
jgi:peptide/nickel transport system substrate-binding protein